PFLLSLFFFSSRRRHTRWPRDWSSDVCSSDLGSYDQFAVFGLTISRSPRSRAASARQTGDLQRDVDEYEGVAESGEYAGNHADRSEERRVGKECSSRRLREY